MTKTKQRGAADLPPSNDPQPNTARLTPVKGKRDLLWRYSDKELEAAWTIGNHQMGSTAEQIAVTCEYIAEQKAGAILAGRVHAVTPVTFIRPEEISEDQLPERPHCWLHPLSTATTAAIETLTDAGLIDISSLECACAPETREAGA